MSENDDAAEFARSRPSDNDEQILTAIINCIRDAGSGDTLSVNDIAQSLGRASFGPLLLVPAVIIVSPLSGIPGLSSIGGLIIALIAAQMVFGRSHVWLPHWIMRRTIGRGRFNRALDALSRPVALIDRLTKPRLTFLVRHPISILPELLCVACGLAMPFLELVPFSSSLLAATVTLIAMGLVAKDGVLIILGALALVGGGWILGFFVSEGLDAIDQ
ncbi:exopolysaccharide biosynthesis protein [Pararhizobium haloflavum]|uniref:exopolysaccharide biosynthesis protein n=1 Tax=Pararhizobium haloflavum TaxID=2037914 RepID=UPI000C19CA97|nr:exopolysaccharide biosynthesis protein [Pararhizobium haloflavum]